MQNHAYRFISQPVILDDTSANCSHILENKQLQDNTNTKMRHFIQIKYSVESRNKQKIKVK